MDSIIQTNNRISKIAVMTSGGDAPGMNAAIRAVVRTAIYHKITVTGILRGYEGMINGDFKELDSRAVGNIIHRGGTILKTARSMTFMTPEGRKEAYDSLVAEGIDGVVAIGGNGTFTGAQIFTQEYGIPFIGVPGTIDNDLYGTDLTIGFDTAVNTALEAMDKIRDTAESHDRLFFVEVMGRHAGFIGLAAGIGSGSGTILMPEDDETVDDIITKLERSAKRKKLFNLVVVCEGYRGGGAMAVAEEVKKHFNLAEIKVTVIGHMQRGGAPTALDRVVASRMGSAAVESLLAGKKNVMIGIQNGEMVEVPFKDAIEMKKNLNPNLLRLVNILSI